MPSVTSYTKAQIDALLAGAKGIPGRTTIATPSTFGVAASGSGKVLTPTGWSFTDQETGAASSELVYHSVSGSFGMATAGWWMLVMQAGFGFNAGATPLPDHVLATVSSYNDVIETTHMLPCTPAPGYAAGRNQYGCEGRIPTHVFQQPTSIITSGGIQPRFYWPGDATQKGPTGTANPFIRVFATRLG